MKKVLLLLAASLFPVCSLNRALAGSEPGLSSISLDKQRMYLSGGARFITVYGNIPLAHRNPRIVRAIIIVHGAGRDADEYFRSVMAAAYLSGALNDTVVIAPRFAAADGTCRDDTETNELTWGCDDWKYGGAASNAPSINSFQVMDEILQRIESRSQFPNEVRVDVIGHSAGAQYVVRYAVANRIDETLSIEPTYFSINPSSYGYLDRFRPVHAIYISRPNSRLQSDRPDLTTDVGPASFEEIRDPEGCMDFDTWPYGLTARKGYIASLTPEEIRQHFVSRRLTLLVGQQDSVPLAGLDTSCAAMFQGANRLERALSFARYGRDRYHVDHPLVIVPLCGHNARCMLTSPVVMPLLFAPLSNSPSRGTAGSRIPR